MKIISNEADKNKTFPKRVECNCCGSILEYDKSDIIYGDYGLPYLDCPACGDRFLLWNEDDIAIYEEQINFPQYFAHTTSENAFNISDEEINRYIKDCIQRIKDGDSRMAYTGTGDTYIFVVKGDDGYDVVVTKDYYDMLYFFTDDRGDDDGE